MDRARRRRIAEAWFYLGGAYGARVQWRVLRGEKLAAARDGKQIKQAMERAIALEPGLDDAYFGLGMYKYYADVAPAAARFLRFLLLLPGGDRKEGLREMLRARSRGRLIQGEADYQLHVIYLWYERQTAPRARAAARAAGTLSRKSALPAADRRRSRTPTSTTSRPASTPGAPCLRPRASSARTTPRVAEVQARLGVARMLDAMHLTDDAIEHLRCGDGAEAAGAVLDRSRWRSSSSARRTIGSARAPRRWPRTSPPSRRCRRSIRTTCAARRRSTCGVRRTHAAPRRIRLSLDGWRRLERNDVPGATTALERSIALAPDDPVARYRYGRVLQARRLDAAALAQFDLAIRRARTVRRRCSATPTSNPRACTSGSATASSRSPPTSIASTLFGAAAETRAAATRALARLGAR